MERVVFVPWERVSLVIAEKQDLETMYRAINNINIIKYLQPIRHNTRETEEAFLNNILQNGEKFFVIMLNDTKEIIWSIWFNEYDEKSRRGIIWICLYYEDKLWKWYWTEAMKLFLKYSFEYIWANKVVLNLFANNQRALKSYQKNWFRIVWIFKEDCYLMGKYEDNISMEMLKSERENNK